MGRARLEGQRWALERAGAALVPPRGAQAAGPAAETMERRHSAGRRPTMDPLDSNLRWPFRRVVATVVRDFRPADSGQLALRAGAKLLVLSKEGDARGWWKGRTLDKGDDRTGYFPKEYVREEPECVGALD
ncbi:unnamed protein product [Plutella xylostella]|uniref:(diamondback moth) hypothetical protein n=1 Tax=Plutella xylostella TaxID=51655 RepID=A0A8S4G483_PLUXY|nr:unnamed protein product [Plutella xylostella]